MLGRTISSIIVWPQNRYPKHFNGVQEPQAYTFAGGVKQHRKAFSTPACRKMKEKDSTPEIIKPSLSGTEDGEQDGQETRLGMWGDKSCRILKDSEKNVRFIIGHLERCVEQGS